MFWFCQLILSLRDIHKQRIYHRDIKTLNVFISSDQILKIGDFGISKNQDEIEGEMVGTVMYMAPEVINSHPYTAESDIWSLGVILYEICTNNRPFGNQIVDQASIMTQILSTEPEDIPKTYSQDL